MPVDLVSALAGDRSLTAAEAALVGQLKRRRGDVFFSDLLYAVSHHYFAPEVAKTLWTKVVTHKQLMSQKLGRNVRVIVATLDYLSNVTRELETLTLMTEDHVAKLADLSMRDGMTDLFNHASCYELLELHLRNNHRYGVGVSVIVIDIDDFKLVNDRHGHQEGDRILIEVTRALREQTRESDICCRFGGEEFVAILPFTNDPAEAVRIAERIRAGVAAIPCGEQQITISAGVAACASSDTARSLLERADRALYRAKRGGKNQVVLNALSFTPSSTDTIAAGGAVAVDGFVGA